LRPEVALGFKWPMNVANRGVSGHSTQDLMLPLNTVIATVQRQYKIIQSWTEAFDTGALIDDWNGAKK